MGLCNNPKLYKYNYVVCLYNRNGLPFNMYILWLIFPKLNIYKCRTNHDKKTDLFYSSDPSSPSDLILAVDMMGKLIEAHMVEMMDHSQRIPVVGDVIVFLIISMS